MHGLVLGTHGGKPLREASNKAKTISVKQWLFSGLNNSNKVLMHKEVLHIKDISG